MAPLSEVREREDEKEIPSEVAIVEVRERRKGRKFILSQAPHTSQQSRCR
jgi:hypothetical protein